MDKLERVTWERRPVTGNNAHVVGYTLLFVPLVFGFVYGILAALDTGELRWIALSAACMAGVWFLAWRIREHDARAFVERENIETPAEPQVSKPPTIRNFTSVTLDGSKINVGKFFFTQGQWYALRSAIVNNGGKLLRDPIRQARPAIFDRADIDNWQSIVEEFEYLGLIDARKNLTEVGRKFFARDPFTRPTDDHAPYNPPYPAPVNGINSSP